MVPSLYNKAMQRRPRSELLVVAGIPLAAPLSLVVGIQTGSFVVEGHCLENEYMNFATLPVQINGMRD
jgi:hypothetical protein